MLTGMGVRGQNLMAYAWPSTFLIPFLLGPIATVYVPLKLLRETPRML